MKVQDIPVTYRPLRPDERAKNAEIARKAAEKAAAELAAAGEYLKPAREAAGNRRGP